MRGLQTTTKKIANIFSSHFSNIVKNLITQPDETALNSNIKALKDMLQTSIEKYENQDGINFVKTVMRNLDNLTFKFKYISFDRTLGEIQKLNAKKVAQPKVYESLSEVKHMITCNAITSSCNSSVYLAKAIVHNLS